jgi:Integrase core domain
MSGSAAGHTTQTDSCSQHTRASRRGGHEQRRAHSSSVITACPTASPNNAPSPGNRRCSRRGRTAFSSPDNGSPYISTVHAIACRALGVRHLRTRPYRPQTNGKAERFIRTLLGSWAYNGLTYATSDERTKALDGWLWEYNHRRRHQALGRQTPITRLNNLLGTYT